MKNYVQPGDNITLTATADVNSGDGVLIGNIFGVATSAAATGEKVTLARHGVFELPKTSALAWGEGDKIYWTGTECSATASGNKLIGAAVAVAANPSATGTVLLDGAVR
ncbi:DUF2190 family protein [Leisingera sp. HS039]|uniref:DUF2190 family protein n=1 Tax=Leisingera sp. HS039 TaxID=2818496 RepID=UPI001B39E3A4|nr:capsid cement protein [Leisingera sp. HS039]MBQ4824381.1 DUF2190 family protein [Leisingera sp. HS039]